VTVSLGFHADAETRVHLNDYGTDRTPILALYNTGGSLLISTLDTMPLADHLAFARSLAGATAHYVAALERFATARPADQTAAA
jgi:hypothetical protein